MAKSKKVLVIGGTGAMGVYLVPELIKMGYDVDSVSRRSAVSEAKGLTYITGDALDEAFISCVLKNNYCAIVDFMIYPTDIFRTRAKLFLDNTEHYVFLSSYRVYGDIQLPVTESAPQLPEILDDPAFLASDDYALKKSRGEVILKESGKTNWTIVRPAITYSKHRFQLVTMEGRNFISRAFDNKPVIVPEEAMCKQATMTWAGDVAKMLARLILTPGAFGECFTVSTSEHHSWQEIAGYYNEILGLKTVPVPMDTFLNVIQPDPNNLSSRWQLVYDRMYDRIIDNSKILEVTGLKQEELMLLKDGLKLELGGITREELPLITGSSAQYELIDNYFILHTN